VQGFQQSAAADSPEDRGGGGLMGLFRKGKQPEKAERSRDGVVKLPQVPETMRRQAEQPTDRERIETEIISQSSVVPVSFFARPLVPGGTHISLCALSESLIESYFDIVRKNFMDLVPKTIMYFLVNHAKENLQNELVSQLYRENLMSQCLRRCPRSFDCLTADTCSVDMMRETPDVARRRDEIQEMRALLQKALDIVNEVRDFNTFSISNAQARAF
jgi:dynamin 1-like protein